MAGPSFTPRHQERNWVADVVRREINPMFFATEGKFTVTTGPNMQFQFVTHVLEFTAEEMLGEPHASELTLNELAEARERGAIA